MRFIKTLSLLTMSRLSMGAIGVALILPNHALTKELRQKNKIIGCWYYESGVGPARSSKEICFEKNGSAEITAYFDKFIRSFDAHWSIDDEGMIVIGASRCKFSAPSAYEIILEDCEFRGNYAMKQKPKN